MARFQILSLGGGGIRGAFITSYLCELEAKLGRPITESFDLIAGTSTGGIIAAGLAAGKSAAEMHDFYVRYGADIFPTQPRYKPKGAMKALYPIANWVFKKKTGKLLDSAFRSRFHQGVLQSSFEEGFGQRTLRDIHCTRLVIPVVNLTLGRPHAFRSLHLPKGVHDADIKISDALIATTAAPTYFPHKQIGKFAYVDGGMWAPDPSMLAVAEAIRIQQFHKRHLPKECNEMDEIHLLSIGTGHSQFSLEPPGDDAGMLYWASRAPEVMGISQTLGAHLPLKFFLEDRYTHINFRMTEKRPLDGVEYIPELFRTGKKRAEETFDRINDQFFQHLRPCFVPFTSTEEEIHVHEFGLD